MADQPAQEIQPDDPEVRSIVLRTQAATPLDCNERLTHCSNQAKASRVVARILRLTDSPERKGQLTAEEISMAEAHIIQGLQRQTYPQEMKCLSAKKLIPASSSLHHLDALLHNGIIRVGERLKEAASSLEEKHPIILPKRGYITTLIIDHFHKKTQHQGRDITRNMIRSKGYCIIRRSKAVGNLTHKCVICRKLRRPREEQRMADLPKERTDPSPPFTYTGMDIFEPFLTKNGRREVKRYGLLFTCYCS